MWPLNSSLGAGPVLYLVQWGEPRRLARTNQDLILFISFWTTPSSDQGLLAEISPGGFQTTIRDAGY